MVEPRAGKRKEGGVGGDFPFGEEPGRHPHPFPQVWSEQDFQDLRQKLLPTYPAAHYFRR